MARDLKAQSVRLAEKIAEHCDGVPWPLMVFLEGGPQGESPRLHYFKPNDPEWERFSRAGRGAIVGTYTRTCAVCDVAGDVLAALKML